jgi:3-oxoacyl-[acyl-carrier protein] reductase
MEIADKRVIVTGGANGIGRSLVEKMVDRGAVVAVLDVDSPGLESLREFDASILCRRCDLTKPEEIGKGVDALYEQMETIDVLVNNAGIMYSAPLISMSTGKIVPHDIGAWQKVIETNLNAVFYITVKVVEKMICKRTKGVIVNVSSASASGNAGQCAYSAAKAGVDALTATWAKELSMLGIRVVGISPGYTETEGMRKALNENVLKECIKKIPMRRLGKKEEIAEGIITIVSNDYFNGKVLALDGGLIL